MFCTNPECHTLFDYRTLRILCERDHVHNPHYTEWLAQRRAEGGGGEGGGGPAREAADIPCGGMPHVHELHRALIPPTARPPPEVMEDVQRILLTHRMVVHAEHVTLHRYRPDVDEPELASMRVQFCLGDFDEAAWRTKLQRREKDRTKKHEVSMVLEMVVHACGDLFRQMVLAARRGRPPAAGGAGTSQAGAAADQRTVMAIYADVRSVLEHANAALCRTATTFGCSVPFFDFGPHRVTLITAQVARGRA